jgi:hypothetical protein
LPYFILTLHLGSIVRGDGRTFELGKEWSIEQFTKQYYQCWWTRQDFYFSLKIISSGVANPSVLTID